MNPNDQQPPPGRQEPPQVTHVKVVSQHAMQIIADMLQGGVVMDAASMVSEAFSIADKFDDEFQKRMGTGIRQFQAEVSAAKDNVSRIVKP